MSRSAASDVQANVFAQTNSVTGNNQSSTAVAVTNPEEDAIVMGQHLDVLA